MRLNFSPVFVILGGGVSKESTRFLPHLKSRTPLVAAELLNSAGIPGSGARRG
ncbi:MAG: hypothetical protein ACLQHS_10280 [Candidatus Limnocylindrales bacterium]|jgi:polyphosphate glucokinase